MNKHAQNKMNEISSWYHNDLFSPENKKNKYKSYKNDSVLQKVLTTWLSVFNWSKNNYDHRYCYGNLKTFMY